MNIPDSKKPSIVTVHETSFPTISIKLDGANYRVWSQIMDMHKAGRMKKEYIIGRKVAPVENDKLMAHFVQCGTAKEVWDAVKRSYLDV